MDADRVLMKLHHLKMPFIHRWKYFDAISDAIIIIKKQEEKIELLECKLKNLKAIKGEQYGR